MQNIFRRRCENRSFACEAEWYSPLSGWGWTIVICYIQEEEYLIQENRGNSLRPLTTLTDRRQPSESRSRKFRPLWAPRESRHTCCGTGNHSTPSACHPTSVALMSSPLVPTPRLSTQNVLAPTRTIVAHSLICARTPSEAELIIGMPSNSWRVATAVASKSSESSLCRECPFSQWYRQPRRLSSSLHDPQSRLVRICLSATQSQGSNIIPLGLRARWQPVRRASFEPGLNPRYRPEVYREIPVFSRELSSLVTPLEPLPALCPVSVSSDLWLRQLPHTWCSSIRRRVLQRRLMSFILSINSWE